MLWEKQQPWRAKAILKKKKKAGGFTLHDFKLYYRAKIIKSLHYWYKNKHIDQQNISKSPKINPHICGQEVFYKGTKIFNEETIIYLMIFGKLDSYLQKNEIGPLSYTTHKY